MWAKVTVINQITKPTAMVINMNRIDAVRPRGLNDSDTASELKIGKEWITVQEDMATIFSPEETKKEQQKHLEKIYELIAGDDAINRFTPDEMIDYIEVLNEQIAQWESETHESFMPKEEN